MMTHAQPNPSPGRAGAVGRAVRWCLHRCSGSEEPQHRHRRHCPHAGCLPKRWWQVGRKSGQGEQLQLLLLLWLRQQRRRGRAGCLRHGTERLGEADRGETVRRCSGRCWCVGTLGGLRREGCARGVLSLPASRMSCLCGVAQVTWCRRPGGAGRRPGIGALALRFSRCCCRCCCAVPVPAVSRPPLRPGHSRQRPACNRAQRLPGRDSERPRPQPARRQSQSQTHAPSLQPRLPRGGAVPCCPDPPLRGGIDRPAAVSGDRCAGCAGSAHGGGGRALPAVGMWEHGRPLPAWLPGWVSRPSSRSVQTQLRHAVWCCRA